MKYRSLFLGALLGGFSFAQALPVEPILTIEVASKIAQNTLKHCSADGYNVAVTVLDKSGKTLVVLRDQKAGPHTLSGSFKKAFTALTTKTSTAIMAQRVSENKSLEGLIHLNKNLVFLGGGLPIKAGNTIVGGIGVGGAPGGHLDEKCAQVGIDSVAKELK